MSRWSTSIHQLPVDAGGRNIASPLNCAEKHIAERVRALAQSCTSRCSSTVIRPNSRGQQQRVALARLAKGAPLMLLDEPLVNLDYKLREELREELTQLFAAGDSTVIYATAEPARPCCWAATPR
jgi:glycerol transport system ATP-binding protein